ncbi:thioredoxin domain-containing protein [Magnetospira thiophila]
MTKNLLARETSPYLLQHKDNPVHWQPWGEAALQMARQNNKPVLLSIGYAACHWCHVMAHESFESAPIADLMNKLFVNIKVDREERPDVDSVYQTALQLMGQQGGWPLTMFLTPDGAPFWGGTYFPPEPRWGRQGFPQVLQSLSEAYHTQTSKVLENVTSLRAALDQATNEAGSGQGGGEPVSPDSLDFIAQALLRMIDPVHGGLQGAPKFPQPTLFRFVWNSYHRTRSTLYKQAVTTTLDRICQGGIYDHLGGGFARYSTDEAWLAPHFEKMLYDNAQLVDLLTTVWQETGSDLYAQRIAETVDWLLREMVISDGDDFAFAGTLDADSEGEEGKFYVWDSRQIDQLLKDDAPLFKENYGVSESGNWEGTNILNRSADLELKTPVMEARLAENRAQLRAVRDRRPRPGRDDKILADWNGLAIAALAHAGVVFGRPDWLQAAETVYAFILRHLVIEDRLRHTWKDGKAPHPAVLDDYAQMIRAALTLYETTGKADYLAQATQWLETVETYHRVGPVFALSASDTTDLIARPRPIFDNVTPSGNGAMAENYARLYLLTGNEAYAEAAESLIRAITNGPRDRLVNQPVTLGALDLLHRGAQVVVIAEESQGTALRDSAFRAAHPHRVFQRIDPGRALPEDHPAHGKTQVENQPTAYVCVGRTCGLPLTDPKALSEALARL